MSNRRALLACLVLFPLVPLSAQAAPPAKAPATLTLQEAYRTAMRTNPTITVLRERVVQAEAARYRAWSAVKPSANFQGSFTHYDQEVVIDFGGGAFGPPTVIQEQDQFGFNAWATLPLVRGPAYPRISAARTGVKAARLREIRSQQDFLYRVAQAYYLVVTRGDTVKALETKLAVDRKHLTASQARLEVGQAPRSEVLRADLVVTEDEQNLLAQRNALQAARRQLAILVGVPGVPEVARPAEPALAGGDDAQMVREAKLWRADLKAAELSVLIADQAVRAAWWSFWPALDLTWTYRWSQAAGFAGRQGQWNLMLVLNFPIYDGGVRYADLRESRSRVAEAQASEKALTLDIEAEIVRLRAELASATAGVVSARKAVALAKTTVDDMEASFGVGAATQLDVLDASQRLLDAELRLTASLHNRDLTRLSLLHAQGRFDPLRRN